MTCAPPDLVNAGRPSVPCPALTRFFRVSRVIASGVHVRGKKSVQNRVKVLLGWDRGQSGVQHHGEQGEGARPPAPEGSATAWHASKEWGAEMVQQAYT